MHSILQHTLYVESQRFVTDHPFIIKKTNFLSSTMHIRPHLKYCFPFWSLKIYLGEIKGHMGEVGDSDLQRSIVKVCHTGNSLADKWLGFWDFTDGARVWSLVRELRSRKPCGVAKEQNNVCQTILIEDILILNYIKRV